MNARRRSTSSRCARAGPEPAQGTPPRIRVLIADDHHVVREGLVAVIRPQRDMQIVAEAADGAEAVALWSLHQPDVGLLDLRMPGVDGIAALEAIRRAVPDARAIVLTTFDGDEDVYRAMRAGARAYVLKDIRREDLLECIRKVRRGDVFMPPAIAAKLAGRVGGTELSRRELEVLSCLARGETNKEVGQSLGISETTVKSHVKALFSKLNVLSRTEAVAAASRRGLIRLY